jgi:hypothetical protein
MTFLIALAPALIKILRRINNTINTMTAPKSKKLLAPKRDNETGMVNSNAINSPMKKAIKEKTSTIRPFLNPLNNPRPSKTNNMMSNVLKSG